MLFMRRLGEPPIDYRGLDVPGRLGGAHQVAHPGGATTELAAQFDSTRGNSPGLLAIWVAYRQSLVQIGVAYWQS